MIIFWSSSQVCAYNETIKRKIHEANKYGKDFGEASVIISEELDCDLYKNSDYSLEELMTKLKYLSNNYSEILKNIND